MTDEQFQAMLDIHTVVPFRVARALAPHWREAAKAERGEGKEVFRKLINVSSTSGTMGNAGQVNYSAAKMGVVGVTKTLAKEWGQFKINVNAVAFGFVETRLTAAKEEGGEMTAPSGEKIELGIPEQMRAMASAIIPLGRPATPRRPPARSSSSPRRWPTTCTARCSTSPAACSGGCTPERARRQRRPTPRYLDVGGPGLAG